jgi:hypothetical protein
MAAGENAVPPLPDIPVIDLGAASPATLALRLPEGLAALLAAGRRHYGRLPVAWADRRSRAWLARSGSPLLAEIAAVERLAGRPGAALLNLAHEWACTSALLPGAGGGFRLRRTLDWPFEGLGRGLVLLRRAAPAGPVLEASWPGFVGSLTALAPGRFALAFNQAPRRRHPLGRPGAWLGDRRRVSRSRALPPAHLLRLVLDRAGDFDQALALLRDTPLCLPGLITLAGPAPGQGVILEREPDAARLRWGAGAAGNHWPSRPDWGRPRGAQSHARALALAAAGGSGLDGCGRQC